MEARLAQLENTTLANYLRYRPADRRVDEKKGRKDGERDKPDAASPNYPFRATIVTGGLAALKAYQHKVDDLIRELEARQASLQQDLDERYASQRDELNSQFRNDLEHIEQKWGPTSAKHSNFRERFTQFSDRARRLEAELGRPPRIHLLYWYGLIMAGVALVEIPINRFAFELYFAETPALSLLIALGVGLALMMLTHFCGTWLKRSTGRITRNQRTLYILGVLAVAALILPTIYLIALLRQHYVQFVEAQQITFEELLQQEGFESVARDVISTDLGTQGWMLLMINLLVVGIGTLVAVVRHDAHPDYEKVTRTRDRLERKLTRLKTKFETATAKVKREYEDRLSSLEKQQERIERDIEDARAQQQKCRDHREQILERVALHIKQRLQAYEEGNESTRKSAAPKAFWRADEEEIRAELRKAFEEGVTEGPKRAAGLHAIS